ncbi:MAG: MATE family efflux transporter [Pseudomonadales bacterium]
MKIPLAASRSEAFRLIKLGSPILVGQLAQTGMNTVDTIMAGNYGARDLAAIAVAQSFWFPVIIFFVGVFAATTTTIAHHSGARSTTGIKTTAQQSLWLALFCAPLGIAVLLNADLLIARLGVDVGVGQIAKDYLLYLALGLPAATLFLALRGFSDGQGETRPIMLINILAFFCNIPLNYIFIFGKFGMPELGGAGCGLATCIVLWIQLLSILVMLKWHQQLKQIRIFQGWSRPRWRDQWQLLNLGVPIGLTGLAEVSLFSAVALIIAPLGTEILAASQVANSISALTFMLPLSVGMAITIRVGIRLGANDLEGARFSSLVGISVAVTLAFLSLTTIILGRGQIAGLYTNDHAVILGASALLIYAALYQLPDAIQISVVSALRGYRDTHIPLLIVLIAYWVISVPLGWCLTMGVGVIEPLGAKGMWIGLVCGLSCAAVLQSFRFRQVLRRVAAGGLDNGSSR